MHPVKCFRKGYPVFQCVIVIHYLLFITIICRHPLWVIVTLVDGPHNALLVNKCVPNKSRMVEVFSLLE